MLFRAHLLIRSHEDMVIDFEPIASIGGQGYYLEDMYLIGKTDAKVLTPGVPYSAEEIEAFLAPKQ